ncbi:hypothetical protein V1503_08275 [Bacillus sp. SCS-151]|uniref:hypothetical protein n=1 Tax=Nanhaiella sioensis TaxID=3115293 RepID=UPI00397C4E5F
MSNQLCRGNGEGFEIVDFQFHIPATNDVDLGSLSTDSNYPTTIALLTLNNLKPGDIVLLSWTFVLNNQGGDEFTHQVWRGDTNIHRSIRGIEGGGEDISITSSQTIDKINSYQCATYRLTGFANNPAINLNGPVNFSAQQLRPKIKL